MLKRYLALAVLSIGALIPLGCETPPESGRAIVDVSRINGGDPVTVTVSSGTTDTVEMEFRWRPYNTMLDLSEATPHGDIIVEHYRITWTRDSAGSGVLPAREENTNIFIPVYNLITGGVRIVTAEEKADPSLAAVPVTMTAHIDFNAREMGTKEKIEFSTSFTVRFE